MNRALTRRSVIGCSAALLGLLCAERMRSLNELCAQRREVVEVGKPFEVSSADPEKTPSEVKVDSAILLSDADNAGLLAWASGSSDMRGKKRAVVVGISSAGSTAAPIDLEALLANIHLESGACAWSADRQTTASLFYQRGDGAGADSAETTADLVFTLSEGSCTEKVWADPSRADFELVYSLWPIRGSVLLGKVPEGLCPDYA